LTLDIDSINKVVEDYDNESKALKEEIYRICWYMRGASISEVYLLSHEERQIIGKIIEKNLEIAKETGQPFF
jgi:hypothetical protein